MFLAKVAAVATALSLTVVLLHGASGLIWPLAFAVQATPQTVPALTFDPTPAPVSAADMQAVLDRDLQQQLTSGALAPGTGAGLAIGVSQHGERRVFAYGDGQAGFALRNRLHHQDVHRADAGADGGAAEGDVG